MHSPLPASDLHAAGAAGHLLTRRYNVRHLKWGRLFGDRYKAVVVEGEDRYHYQTLMDYIHLNPVRARIIRPKAGESVLQERVRRRFLTAEV